MHHPTDRIAHTTAFVTPVVEHWLEREIAQWVLPMKVNIIMYNMPIEWHSVYNILNNLYYLVIHIELYLK